MTNVLTKINALKWPQDARKLAALPLLELQIWISGQDPRELIYMAQDPNYVRFIKYHYLWPLRFKRFGLKMWRMFWGI